MSEQEIAEQVKAELVAKDRRHRIIAAVAVVVAVVLVVAMLVIMQQQRQRADEQRRAAAVESFAAQATAKLVYHVGGTTTVADITYSTADGTGQQSDVDVPLKNKRGDSGIAFVGFDVPKVAHISAQNGKEFGTISCSIEYNGTIIAENESSGAYAIATCTART